MDVVLLAGRILFALIFVMSGLTLHLLQSRQGIEYARAAGAPAPQLLVPLSGLAIVVGGISVAAGIYADVGALLLIAFLLPTAFFMHAFWKIENPQEQSNQMAHFLKNVALVGAALMVFYLYNQGQGGVELSVTDPLFDRW